MSQLSFGFEVPEGHVPSVAEAMAKLAELRRDGPSEAVFTFKWWRAQRGAATQA